MEREYTVIVNNREDLAAIEAELTASTGEGPIPSRSVDIANPRLGSKVQTHFMLTDAEALALEADPRIRAVEIPPEQRTDVKMVRRATLTGEFKRDELINDKRINWGLQRSNYKTNAYGNTSTISTVFEYAMDGNGIDVVIQDSGIEAGHPEWQDANSVSRLQQIDWYTESGVPGSQDATFYTDYDGHGTHCAGIVAGKTYGWAKAARIYAQKLSGLEGPLDPDNGISISNAFDTIRLWHNAKGGSRPTVVNMSWGYSSVVNGNPSSGTYRGTSWTWGAEYSNDNALWDGVGVVSASQNGDREIPARLASIDAEVDDMIADGIHVVIAAGNDYYKHDDSTGADYNNSVVFGGFTFFYHRGSSPHSDGALKVGNIDTAVVLDGTVYRDRPAASSTRGPAIDIWAPGQNIMSTTSNDLDAFYVSNGFVQDYPEDTDYKIMSIGGTSMAAPQVAGVMACHLEAFPEATPAQLKTRIQDDAQPVIYTTGSDTDYRSFTTSLLGSPNRMLWNRYGRQPGQLTDSASVIPAPTPSYSLSASAYTLNEGATFRVTLTTKYVPNGTDVAYAISGVTGSDLDAGNTVGVFTVQNGSASLDFTIREDLNTEGDETLTLALDNGQASIDITITDTSVTPPPVNWEISVTNNGNTGYTMSGTDRQGAVSGDNPTIRILRNDTLTFNVSATGHPFWLKTAESTGTGDAIPGVSNNGAEEGTVAYQFTSTGTFYYACEIHSSMAGPIIVS
jgi:subtilisin family serine protease/plastocyanin